MYVASPNEIWNYEYRIISKRKINRFVGKNENNIATNEMQTILLCVSLDKIKFFSACSVNSCNSCCELNAV